jgi:hypothetical protein
VTRLSLPRRWCGSSSRGDRKLSQALQKEIDHEAQNEDKQISSKLGDFEVVTEGMNVQLKRQIGKEGITVRFLIQVVETHDSDSMSEEEEASRSPVAAITSNLAGLKSMFSSPTEEPEAEIVSESIANRYFSVVVEKGSRALLFDCAWQERRLRINHLAFFPDAKSAHRVAVLGDDAENTGYEGPEVSDLSDDLSTLWYEYLMARGVNETMGAFMTSFSKEKEQQEYVAWLGQTLKFVED